MKSVKQLIPNRTRTRTQWVSPSPDSSPDSDSTLVDSDSDSTSVDSDSSAVDSDSGLMDSDSDSDSTHVDSDSQWVQVSPVRNVGLQGKAFMCNNGQNKGINWITKVVPLYSTVIYRLASIYMIQDIGQP